MFWNQPALWEPRWVLSILSRPLPASPKPLRICPVPPSLWKPKDALLEILKEMASALGGRWIKLGAGDKAAYHAAAVMSSNYLVTLVKMAADLWDSFGIPREQAIQALLPLLKGTINNIENRWYTECPDRSHCPRGYRHSTNPFEYPERDSASYSSGFLRDGASDDSGGCCQG